MTPPAVQNQFTSTGFLVMHNTARLYSGFRLHQHICTRPLLGRARQAHLAASVLTVCLKWPGRSVMVKEGEMRERVGWTPREGPWPGWPSLDVGSHSFAFHVFSSHLPPVMSWEAQTHPPCLALWMSTPTENPAVTCPLSPSRSVRDECGGHLHSEAQ